MDCFLRSQVMHIFFWYFENSFLLLFIQNTF
jgi:hypothetical protein